MEIVIAIIAVALLIMWFVNGVVEATQKVQAHNRRAYCRARLRFMGVGDAGRTKV